MRKTRIFQDVEINSGSQLSLNETAHHHLQTVLRKKVGDEVYLFNNSEYEYYARIEALNKKECRVSVLERIPVVRESPLEITLYQALSKSDKMDLVIQKSVELGVHRIVPVTTDFSQVKMAAEKHQKKLRHWNNIVINACEQSGRTLVPDISVPMPLKQAMQDCDCEEKFILHPAEGENIKHYMNRNYDCIALFIGPEGGFSEPEVEYARQTGCHSIRFGPRILRTETTPLALMAVMQTLWGDC